MTGLPAPHRRSPLRRSFRSAARLAVLFTSGLTVACAGAVESSRVEDQARREVPVAICLKAMQRYGAAGVVAQL
jgi:hypothetical protein